MTTPSKPDLVALADLHTRLRDCSKVCVYVADERGLNHPYYLSEEEIEALRHLASHPSLYEAGLRDMRERASRLAHTWSIPSNVRLRAGEMTAQEMRTAQAIACGISSSIDALPADGGEKSSEGGCICQGQHRRGYCTEPGCPYSLSDTTRPALSVAVKVKALTWRDHRPDSFPEPAWSAETPFGFYHIEEVSASDSPAYVVRLHANHFIADKDGFEEAKAAAQADYEKRVRSCISTTSVDDGVVRVLSELRDRRLLNDVDDGLHEEIAESLIKAVRG